MGLDFLVIFTYGDVCRDCGLGLEIDRVVSCWLMVD